MKKVSEFISTGLFIGYFPFAPGTFGSLTAAIIVFIVNLGFGFSPLIKIFSVAATFVMGLLTVSHFLKDSKEKDPGYIVIDEWAGQVAAYSLVQITLENLIAGFILFRIFDITKIFPIKNTERLRGSLGIMADDIIAGLYAAVCLWAWNYIHIFGAK
ncbi:MAG: phosphatidylglycerophosphatase A [Spirochaetia bacterium]|nr:phosphatidylglycerophosphatase A [Spirochaetia bacterium]